MYTDQIKLRTYCWSGLRFLVIKKCEDVKGVIRGINRRRIMQWPKEKGQKTKNKQRSATHYIENQISIMAVISDKWNVHCSRYCMSVVTCSELLFESVICCNNYVYFRFIMEKQSDRPTRVSSFFIYYISHHRRCKNIEQRYILHNYVLWGKCTWSLILKLVCPLSFFTFGHCIICRSIYELWLPL